MKKDIALLLLRLATGGLMLTHGYPKIQKLFAAPFADQSFPDPFGMGAGVSLLLTALVESVVALFVVIGFKTKLSSIPLAFTMAVAAFIVHAGDPVSSREKALLFLAGYLVLALIGGGKYSLDGLMKRR